MLTPSGPPKDMRCGFVDNQIEACERRAPARAFAGFDSPPFHRDADNVDAQHRGFYDFAFDFCFGFRPTP